MPFYEGLKTLDYMSVVRTCTQASLGDGNLFGCRAGHHDFYGVASNRRIGPLAVRAKHAGDAYTRYGVAADFAVVDSATADSLDCSPADGGRIVETGIA